MTSTAIKPFEVAIPEEEVSLLHKKLELARLPTHIASAQWGESNGVTHQLMADTVAHWRTRYDWRAEEAKINAMPQFTTDIALDGAKDTAGNEVDFGTFNMHFVHAKSTAEGKGAIPLLFLHGWPGNFVEVQKVLPAWTAAGFDVVAPSLPGYGFSSYTDREGLKTFHIADIMHKLMQRLGYHQYAVQGGDWGSLIGHFVAIRHPKNVRALHLNMIFSPPPPSTETSPKPQYSAHEQATLARGKWFWEKETAYQKVQASKTRTLGFAMHDSPVGMLAWMTDKLKVWTDAYPWTADELITWTLLHYFPGPTPGFNMYRENFGLLDATAELGKIYEGGEPGRDGKKGPHFLKVPVGVSSFVKEIGMPPRAWAERGNNVVFWREYEIGGHFAAWEKPEELGRDVVEFVKENWGENAEAKI